MKDKKQSRHPSQKDKMKVYENLLHEIQMNVEVNMDPAAVREILNRICRWSYAHRQGNGEISDAVQQELIDGAFWKLDIRNNFEHTK
jgi:hypothetical protein